MGAGSANGVEMVQGPVQTPALTIHRRKRRRRRRRRPSGGTERAPLPAPAAAPGEA